MFLLTDFQNTYPDLMVTRQGSVQYQQVTGPPYVAPLHFHSQFQGKKSYSFSSSEHKALHERTSSLVHDFKRSPTVDSRQISVQFVQVVHCSIDQYSLPAHMQLKQSKGFLPENGEAWCKESFQACSFVVNIQIDLWFYLRKDKLYF